MQVHKRVFHRFFTHFSGFLACLLLLIGVCSCAVSTSVSSTTSAEVFAGERLIPHLAPSSSTLLQIVSTPITSLEITQQILGDLSNMSLSIIPHSSSSYFVPEETPTSSILITQTSSSAFDIHLVEPSPTSHLLYSSLELQERSISLHQPPQTTSWVGSNEVVGTGQPAAQLSHEAMTWITSQPSSAQQLQGDYQHSLPAGTVAGIVIASLGFLGVLGAALGFLALRRFRPLHAKAYDNSYSSGDNFSYLDNLQVSYINHHVQLPKDSSEEMFSLDNDSFLNSLEAMTMENYWAAEESKNTKV